MEHSREQIDQALGRWQAVKDGEENVIVSDLTLDILEDHFRDDESDEAWIYFRHSFSWQNPAQVGVLDAYVLTLSDPGHDGIAWLEHSGAVEPD